MSSVHQIAAAGFGAGTNELYDRARPSYRPDAIAHIHSSLAPSERYNIAELGSGTGIFTRALLGHPDWSDSIREIRAIEPSAGMRDVFSRTVGDPRVSVSEGSFESIMTIPDGWANVVIIAQAFHWCADYEAASAELARILKPDGTLALIWNLEDRARADWVLQVRERIEQHEQGTPQFRLGRWRQCFLTTNFQQYFTPPQERVFEYVLPTSFEGVIERACSKSYIAVLDNLEKKQVVDDLQNILEAGKDVTWIDKEKGLFEYPYQCFVVTSRRLM